MFARTTQFQLQPNKMDEFQRILRDEIVPTLQRQPGFRSILILTNAADNTVLGITQWVAEADILAIISSGVNATLLSTLRPLVATPPKQESYTVLLQLEPI